MLIKADAIGVNFIDTYFRSGHVSARGPVHPRHRGLRDVAAVGDDVAALSVGDRVVTAQANGALRRILPGAADSCAYVPDAVPSDVAASALLQGMTAHYLLKSIVPGPAG